MEVKQDITPEQLAEQEERDFLAAANSEPEPHPEPSSDADLSAQEGGEPAQDDDFDLSSLPASAIEKLEAQLLEKIAPQMEQRLSGRLRNIEGHIGGLKHNLNQLSTAKAAAEAQGADAPTKAQISEATQSGVKLSALKEDFPEWAEAIEESMSAVASRIPQVDENAINERIRSSETRARQLARLDMAHPDWEQAIQSEQYQNWLSNQPNDIQALVNSENASDAIKVLNAYVDSTSASTPDLTAQSRQRNRLESAVTPTAGGQATRRQPKTEHEEFLSAYNS
jgi:hypothetical protein